MPRPAPTPSPARTPTTPHNATITSRADKAPGAPGRPIIPYSTPPMIPAPVPPIIARQSSARAL